MPDSELIPKELLVRLDRLCQVSEVPLDEFIVESLEEALLVKASILHLQGMDVGRLLKPGTQPMTIRQLIYRE